MLLTLRCYISPRATPPHIKIFIKINTRTPFRAFVIFAKNPERRPPESRRLCSRRQKDGRIRRSV